MNDEKMSMGTESGPNTSVGAGRERVSANTNETVVLPRKDATGGQVRVKRAAADSAGWHARDHD
jgi:hypothetical protein